MCLKYVQAPPPNSALGGKIAKIAKNLVFPIKLNRVMVLTHILHQPTRYTFSPNRPLGRFGLVVEMCVCLFVCLSVCLSNVPFLCYLFKAMKSKDFQCEIGLFININKE